MEQHTGPEAQQLPQQLLEWLDQLQAQQGRDQLLALPPVATAGYEAEGGQGKENQPSLFEKYLRVPAPPIQDRTGINDLKAAELRCSAAAAQSKSILADLPLLFDWDLPPITPPATHLGAPTQGLSDDEFNALLTGPLDALKNALLNTACALRMTGQQFESLANAYLSQSDQSLDNCKTEGEQDESEERPSEEEEYEMPAKKRRISSTRPRGGPLVAQVPQTNRRWKIIKSRVPGTQPRPGDGPLPVQPPSTRSRPVRSHFSINPRLSDFATTPASALANPEAQAHSDAGPVHALILKLFENAPPPLKEALDTQLPLLSKLNQVPVASLNTVAQKRRDADKAYLEYKKVVEAGQECLVGVTPLGNLREPTVSLSPMTETMSFAVSDRRMMGEAIDKPGIVGLGVFEDQGPMCAAGFLTELVATVHSGQTRLTLRYDALPSVGPADSGGLDPNNSVHIQIATNAANFALDALQDGPVGSLYASASAYKTTKKALLASCGKDHSATGKLAYVGGTVDVTAAVRGGGFNFC